MKNVVFSEILDLVRYEKVREEFHSRIIALKKRRRVPIGPMITFVFENHDTVIFQIQEMIRAERIVDEQAIQHEIDTYNQLLPEASELAATLFIELKDPGRIQDEITRFHGMNNGESTYMQVGSDRLPGNFLTGQSDDRRISAVQYVRFHFSDGQRAVFVAGKETVRLVIDHPEYSHSAIIEGELRKELAGDFEEKHETNEK
ncbi:MAG: DUF3501 family protein [Acidobacteria bacterium]|nr:DUF3501 family protein [Acidobacteriota bacterium]